ncbi:MAG: Ppx/GppA family phosphatase [Ignavibacteria bacterium]|nr:Ppx/GppA family phosphatase [Ignavibacteria bacterium]
MDSDLLRKTIIDIGTNTILMLIADYDYRSGKVITVSDIQRIPRLGKGVDTNKKILTESFWKASEILSEYKKISNEHNSKEIIAVGTSFLRDSSNKDEFIKSISDMTGINISILSGKDEAKWTFIGGIYDKLRTGKFTTIDIGGGSTEITSAELPTDHLNDLIKINPAGISLDIGSVRIKERFLGKHPPNFDDIIKAENFINHELEKMSLNLSDSFLIGVAGTITTLGAYKLKLNSFSPEKVDGISINIDETEEFLKEFATSTIEEIYTRGKYMHGRADIITSGVLILKCFMEKFGFREITISTKGLRYGIFIREISKLLN